MLQQMWSTIYIYIYIVKLATVVEDNPKVPFSIATTPSCRCGRYFFPWNVLLTLDTCLIRLSVKQGGIKYHFLVFCMDSTWDWTSGLSGFTHSANIRICMYVCMCVRVWIACYYFQYFKVIVFKRIKLINYYLYQIKNEF